MGGVTSRAGSRAAVLAAVFILVLGAVYLGTKPSAEDGVQIQEEPTGEIGVGATAPKFKALDVEGLPFDSAAVDGQLWLVFNATWCASCRAEIPEVQRLAQRDDVSVVSIYLREDSGKVRSYSEKLGLEYRQIPDANAEISTSFGISSVPAHVLVKDGEVVFKKIGAITEADITQVLP